MTQFVVIDWIIWDVFQKGCSTYLQEKLSCTAKTTSVYDFCWKERKWLKPDTEVLQFRPIHFPRKSLCSKFNENLHLRKGGVGWSFSLRTSKHEIQQMYKNKNALLVHKICSHVAYLPGHVLHLLL